MIGCLPCLCLTTSAHNNDLKNPVFAILSLALETHRGASAVPGIANSATIAARARSSGSTALPSGPKAPPRAQLLRLPRHLPGLPRQLPFSISSPSPSHPQATSNQPPIHTQSTPNPYGWTGQRSSSCFFDRPPATLGVFASLDRF
jgi:hypothetical protein